MCTSCPASLACVAGLVSGVYKCRNCGDTWALVYVLNTLQHKTVTSDLRRGVKIPIPGSSFEACTKRDRDVEGKFWNMPMRDCWAGIVCPTCLLKTGGVCNPKGVQ